MNLPKKLILGVAVFCGLSLGTLTGWRLPASWAATAPSIPVAHAAQCDGVAPPPGVDCPVAPTPTPKR